MFISSHFLLKKNPNDGKIYVCTEMICLCDCEFFKEYVQYMNLNKQINK